LKKEKIDTKNLREGFTTGACAAAAAKACAHALVEGSPISTIETTLPIGKKVTFELNRCELMDDYSICSIIKDGGDDPDCTHGAEITAKVSLNKTKDINIFGGEGVATVTQPGLGLEVGTSAINPVPRKNITEMVKEILDGSSFTGAQIEISVPDGKERAKKTLNSRLGLLGGISILGTTGIVRPYSTAAFRSSVVQAIDVAKSNGANTLVFTTGGRSEKYAMDMFPQLKEVAFIQVGDFIGAGLKRATKKNIDLIIIVGMMGKLTKMADGKMMTHASGSKVNTVMLSEMAKELGAKEEVVKEMAESQTARRVLELCDEHNHPEISDMVCERVNEKCLEHVEGKIKMNTYLVDFEGDLLGKDEFIEQTKVEA
jgi:cobalt-precorrin-5B (C1)-methyltransferase